MLTVYCCKINRPTLKGHARDIRVLWLLEELKTPHERVYLDMMAGEHKRPEFRKIHPQGKVPAIKDGDFVLFESSAIVSYVADKFGSDAWIPKAGSKERHIYDQWMYFAMSSLEPLSVRVFGARMQEDPAVLDGVVKEIGDRLRDALGIVEAHLAKNPYVLGTTFTAADVVMTKCIDFANIPQLIGDYPQAKAYVDKNLQRPAYQKAYAAHTQHN
jgi:glutathione S-transferase